MIKKILLLPTLLMTAGLISLCAQLPPGFAREQIATGLDPTKMALAPDGRIFIAEKSGRVRIVRNGELLSEPFLTIPVDNYNERGLSGIAFDPDFEQNNWFYAFYTVPGANHNRVSRFKANGDFAVPGSEEILLELDPMEGAIHNAGGLAFGDDGKLYIATGDGADPQTASSLFSLLGKVLRINPDGLIPADNPYYDLTTGSYRAVWAMGFRNPFTFVKRPGENTFFVNDVGSEFWEEVNEVAAGTDHGWPELEGYWNGTSPPADYRDPLHAYSHDPGCAVTGGVFYAPDTLRFPAPYHGKYFFGDYCEGVIRVMDPNSGAVEGVFAEDIDRPIGMLTTPRGDLYYLARAGIGGGSEQDNTSTDQGSLWRIYYTGSGAPTIAVQPVSLTVPLGEDAVFNVLGSGAPPLTYQWLRDDEPLPGENAPTLVYPGVTLADDGRQFRCRITNAEGSINSAVVTLYVTPNSRPAPVIELPAAGTTYAAGDTLFFQGAATDPEDGMLTSWDLTWRIDFHHDDHTHPALENAEGVEGGFFVIPRVGELDDNVWYRVLLTATDSEGLTQTVYRDVLPEKTEFTVRSEPPGLVVNVDGRPVTTPHTTTSVVGLRRTLAAAPTQSNGEALLRFREWMNGAQTELFTFLAGELPEITVHYDQTILATGDGSGLLGQYYSGLPDNAFSGKPELERVDPVVDFDWLGGSPAPGVLENDFFAVRWQGEILPPLSDTYTFRPISDDGFRMWIDNELVIDQWVPQPPTEMTATVEMEGGRRYPIRIEYFEEGGGALVRLRWESTQLPLEVVPTSQLFPVELPPANRAYSFSLAPVPVRDRLTVTISTRRNERVTFSLFDVTGRLVRRQVVMSYFGATATEIDFSNLAAGFYVLELDGNIFINERIKVVKR